MFESGLPGWLEARCGHHHPRSQGEDEVLQEPRRTLNIRNTASAML